MLHNRSDICLNCTTSLLEWNYFQPVFFQVDRESEIDQKATKSNGHEEQERQEG